MTISASAAPASPSRLRLTPASSLSPCGCPRRQRRETQRSASVRTRQSNAATHEEGHVRLDHSAAQPRRERRIPRTIFPRRPARRGRAPRSTRGRGGGVSRDGTPGRSPRSLTLRAAAARHRSRPHVVRDRGGTARRPARHARGSPQGAVGVDDPARPHARCLL